MDDISVTGYKRLPKLYSSLQVCHVAQIVFQCQEMKLIETSGH